MQENRKTIKIHQKYERRNNNSRHQGKSYPCNGRTHEKQQQKKMYFFFSMEQSIMYLRVRKDIKYNMVLC